MYNDLLIKGSIVLVNEVIFSSIDEREILLACLRTKGAAGVSCLDAEDWQIILRSKIFGTAATGLRRSIACLTIDMCTIRNTNPESLESCRLIPLDKNPGMRSIGIREVIRRIIGKAVTSCLRNDILNTNGNL